MRRGDIVATAKGPEPVKYRPTAPTLVSPCRPYHLKRDGQNRNTNNNTHTHTHRHRHTHTHAKGSEKSTLRCFLVISFSFPRGSNMISQTR